MHSEKGEAAHSDTLPLEDGQPKMGVPMFEFRRSHYYEYYLMSPCKVARSYCSSRGPSALQ